MKQLERIKQQQESNLRYELKINDMQLIPAEKQSLTQCLQNILGLESGRLVQIIYENIKAQIDKDTLPRKLDYLRDDATLLEEYRKYPHLLQFQKVTLEMLSQLHQTKITLYSLDVSGMLAGVIINEKGYQQSLKIARSNTNFYEVKDCSYSHHSSTVSFSVQSNNSSKLFQAFQLQVKAPVQQKKNSEDQAEKALPKLPLLTKSMSHKSPLFKKFQQKPSISFLYKTITISNKIHLIHQIPIPNRSMNIKIIICICIISIHKFTISLHNSYIQQRQNSNKSEGYINSFNSLPQQNQNNTSMSPGKMSNSRRQNNTRLMEIDENQRYSGRLKFFDDAKNYGFIIMDADQSDIFVHCDDLQKAGISKERVKSYKQSEGMIRFQFKVMIYVGKYRESRKAVDLVIIDDGLGNTYQ